MTPAICVAVLALAKSRSSRRTTRRAISAGCGSACRAWGFLMDRSTSGSPSRERARDSADRWLGGPWEVVPNGVLIPDEADPTGREHTVVFAGGTSRARASTSCCARGRRSTVAPARGSSSPGADPLAVRLLLTRLGVPDTGIEIVGFLSQDALTDLLRSTKALLAPSLGGESFGMVLTRAFACATPVVASDIEGYREVVTTETARLRPAGRRRRARRRRREPARRRAAPGRDGSGGAAARRGALRVAGHRAAARGDLRARRRGRRRRAEVAAA